LHNGENRADPVVWDAAIVMRDAETAQGTTADFP